MSFETESVRARQRRARLLSFSACSALVAACSLSDPTLREFSPDYGKALGGQSGASLGGSDAGLAGTSNGAAGSSLGGDTGAEAGAGAQAGEGGAVDVPEPDPVQGVTLAASQIALRQPVVTGVPPFALLTRYDTTEAEAAGTNAEPPSFAPYDPTSAAFWDNLVAEELAARVRNVMFVSRGAYSKTTTDFTGPNDGAANPRHLASWVSALQRAGVEGQLFGACRIEVSALQDIYSKLYTTTAPIDLSYQGDWNEVFWLRGIKPFFDTLPSKDWTNPPIVSLDGITAKLAINIGGNASKLMAFLYSSFATAYGKNPVFYLDPSWFALDSTLDATSDQSRNCPAFSAPSTPNAFTKDCGTIAPGYIDPGYFDSTNTAYKSSSAVIDRSKQDAYGQVTFTLDTGLSNAFGSGTPFSIISGHTDVSTSSGVYRSSAWDHTNRYLNLIRRYDDLPTRTLLLQAENCDEYFDTTSGNSGGVFTRAGDLDVRALTGSGWAVTSTASGEWIQFDDVDFSSGNYEFLARYSTSGKSAALKLGLDVDGAHLAPVILPPTTNSDTFAVVSLGVHTFERGQHVLRFRFLDGLTDLDAIFVRKLDKGFALADTAGRYASVTNGGGPLGAFRSGVTVASIFEEFMFDDLNGGKLEDGDLVDIQTYNGYYCGVSAGQLVASLRTPQPSDRFIVKWISGASIAAGSTIALSTADGSHFWTSESGKMTLSGTTIGDAQTLKLSDNAP